MAHPTTDDELDGRGTDSLSLRIQKGAMLVGIALAMGLYLLVAAGVSSGVVLALAAGVGGVGIGAGVLSWLQMAV